MKNAFHAKVNSMLFVLLMGLAFNQDLIAQPTWRQLHGPYSGNVNYMARKVSTRDMLVMTNLNLYRYTEENSRWEPINFGLGFGHSLGASFQTIADNGENLFYMALNNQVIFSQDFGDTWQSVQVFNDINHRLHILCLTEDLRLLALASNFQGFPHDKYYYSDDGGLTWEENDAPSDLRFHRVVHLSEQNMFVAGTNKGIWKSTDNGLSWESYNSGPLNDGMNMTSLHHIEGTEILLANNFQGMFRSEDAGMSWAQLPEDIDASSISDDGSGRVLASARASGFWLSEDYGQSWTLIKENGMPESVDFVHTDEFKTIFLSGIPKHGLVRNTVQGGVWEPAGIPNIDVDAIHIVPQTEDFLITTSNSIYRSTNRGESWQLSNSGLNTPFFKRFGNIQNDVVAMSVFGGFYRSADGGQNWTRLNTSFPLVDDLEISPLGRLFYMSTFSGGNERIMMSSNNGANFVPFGQGLPQDESLISLKFAQQNQLPGFLYCSTSDGVYRTIAGSAPNWQPFNRGNLTSFGKLSSSPDGNTLVLYSNSRIAFTKTVEDDWKTTSYPPTSIIYDLLPVSENDWFVATDQGIFWTPNSGMTWQLVNEGLVDLRVRSLAITPDGYLLVGTVGSGMFISQFSITSVQENPLLAFEFHIWPNPANDMVYVENTDVCDQTWFACNALGRVIVLPTQHTQTHCRLNIQHLYQGVWWIYTQGHKGKMLIKQ